MYQLTPVSEETFDSVLRLCEEYASERNLEWLVHADTWRSLLTKMCSEGTAYVLLRDLVPIGMLLMVRHQHIMNPETIVVNPIVVYIKDRYRNGWGMALMLQQLDCELSKAHHVTVSLGEGSNIKEETMLKYGYRKLETVYIKEK